VRAAGAGREENAVGPRHPRPTESSPEDREFVSEHDDFQLLEIGRPKTQRRELKRPTKDHVAEREEHEASWSQDNPRILRKP